MVRLEQEYNIGEVMSVHRVRCLLPYSQDQLFDLAADVENYPTFVPGWVAAKIRKREGNTYYTDQVVRFAMVRKRFSSKTVLQRPERIDVTSTDGPVRNFHLTWLFEPRPANGCQVSLSVDLDLGSERLPELFAQTMVRAIGPIMSAFETQAHRLYDPASSWRVTSGESAVASPSPKRRKIATS